jgi:hypothetical protein
LGLIRYLFKSFLRYYLAPGEKDGRKQPRSPIGCPENPYHFSGLIIKKPDRIADGLSMNWWERRDSNPGPTD